MGANGMLISYENNPKYDIQLTSETRRQLDARYAEINSQFGGLTVHGDIPAAEPADRPFRPVPGGMAGKLEAALTAVDDAVDDISYHSRRFDPDLTVDDMGRLVMDGHLTEVMLVDRFRLAVRRWFAGMEATHG